MQFHLIWNVKIKVGALEHVIRDMQRKKEKKKKKKEATIH